MVVDVVMIGILRSFAITGSTLTLLVPTRSKVVISKNVKRQRRRMTMNLR